MTQMALGGEGSPCLRHYDALCTKSDMWLTLNSENVNEKKIFLVTTTLLNFVDWKNDKKVPVFFFETTIFRWYTLGKFYIAKLNYFSGISNKGNKKFWKIFDWLLCWRYWKWNYPWQVLKNSCISITQPVPGEPGHTGCYVYNSLVHIIYVLFTCM